MPWHDRGCDVTGTTARQKTPLHQFGEAEIKDLGVTSARDHDVVGFQIPMDNALCVGVGQAVGGVLQKAKQLPEVNRIESCA